MRLGRDELGFFDYPSVKRQATSFKWQVRGLERARDWNTKEAKKRERDWTAEALKGAKRQALWLP
ncbi:MAG TPA: hypothetical protein VLA49_12885 [Anaerolineales bacterium]|nr:hypothetical protein [Anaerolineales bacterium]